MNACKPGDTYMDYLHFIYSVQPKHFWTNGSYSYSLEVCVQSQRASRLEYLDTLHMDKRQETSVYEL